MLTEAHRLAQSAIGRAVLAELGEDLLSDAVVDLALEARGKSDAVAARYYAAFRQAEGIADGFVLGEADPLAPATARERIADAANRFGQGPGEVVRVVLGGGRDRLARSLGADSRAIGWQRVCSSSCCSFCAMLAGRGAVYRSARAAGDGRGYHRSCACTVEPVFRRGTPLPARSQVFADLYDEAGSFDAFKVAFRERAEA
ncbi:hypothetical protein ACFVXH_03240 [Kitasatospora sp. NPDC058184]|uniref:VG15 protein n=1 Tax=Kitasatospora sp. NPDC058184 TaxID=3346370 RepID=UPI0036DF9F99